MRLIEKQNTFLLTVVTFYFALIWLLVVMKTEYSLSNIEMKKWTERCCFNHLADPHNEVNSGYCVFV